ncbi:MAG: hypothetical protein ACREL9_07205 [Gemmatimonadales bacterium]
MMLLALTLLQAAAPLTQQTGTFRSPRVRESSGIAASRAHPGVLWTHNDSGDGPYLYATDLSGADRGALLVAGARALDWEDAALGPCPARYGRTGLTCVYVADTGDNFGSRSRVQLYAVPEPDPPASAADTQRATAAADFLHVRYPDGPHDVEAVYVSPQDGAVYLVSKGQSRAIRQYRVDRERWNDDTVVTAQLVSELPIRPDRGDGRWVTGAAIRPDGQLVAILTYPEVYFFTPGEGGRLALVDRPKCDTPGSGVLWEAIDFLDDSTLVLTSESERSRRRGIISTVRCP